MNKQAFYKGLAVFGIVIVLVMVGLFYYFQNTSISTGSVGLTGEYRSTSTAVNTIGFLNDDNPTLLKKGYGTFGSLIVEAAGSAGGLMNFYDATTTIPTKRAATMSTSTIIIASIPTNLAAGTYTFDVRFNTGLIVDFTGTASTMGTSTITYR